MDNDKVIKKHINLGILAHVDAGKTTLTEAFLFKSGVLRKAGRVDSGDSFLDTEAQERERGITIIAKQAELAFKETEVTLLDTPGHVDFSAEAESVLQVLDYCILLISAADGVKGHTLTLWSLLKEYGIPCIIFVNKMDQPGADKAAVLAGIKENLSRDCLDFTDEGDELYENVAMCDEQLMEEYMEDPLAVSTGRIAELIHSRKLFPCLFGSALKMEGIDELISLTDRYCMSPDYGTDFSARVFKISRDSKGERLTHVKIMGGSLKVKDILNGEKINQIRCYSGEKYDTLQSAEAGRIVTLTGLNESRSGMGYGALKDSHSLYLEPVLGYSVKAMDGIDSSTLLKYLRIIEEEDPQLIISFNEEHHEISAQVMGEVQLQVLKRNMHDRFSVEIEFGEGRVVYKETIADPVEGVGHFEPLRHYAEVHLLLEPAERGSGLSFGSMCSEDILDKNWQRLILTHLKEKQHRGVLTGAALTDTRISILTGRAHPKHTEGGDFRQATYRAVRQGLMQTGSILLEPYYFFRIELPASALGHAMTDIEAMHGSMDAPSSDGVNAVLTGRAAVACIRNYAKDLAAYTAGCGSISLSLAGYDICHNTEEVIEKTGYMPEADLKNTPDSVFCAHGAGFVVPWSEVFDYMHVESAYTPFTDNNEHKEESYAARVHKTAGSDSMGSLGTDEVDAILNRTFYANSSHTVDSQGRRRQGLGAREELKPAAADPYDDYEFKPAAKKEEYMVVDGYNIIFAWQELKELAKDNMDAARDKLVDLLSNYQGYTGMEIMLVFDAYRSAGRGRQMDYAGLHVIYTAENETADMYIERFATKYGKKHNVIVATNDMPVRDIAWGSSCMRMSAGELERLVRG